MTTYLHIHARACGCRCIDIERFDADFLVRAGGTKPVELRQAPEYFSISDRIGMGDDVLSVKDHSEKGVVIRDSGIHDREPYKVHWENDGTSSNWLKPDDIRRPFNVDPEVHKYLQNGQISQVVSGGQVCCVCLCTYAHMYIMRMCPLNLHAYTNAYTRCGYLSVSMSVSVCVCVSLGQCDVPDAHPPTHTTHTSCYAPLHPECALPHGGQSHPRIRQIHVRVYMCEGYESE